MTDEQTRPSRWGTFAGWHRTEKLWQDIYTRAASGLIVALVIYLVAAVSGVVTRKPIPWIALTVNLGSVVNLLYQLRRYGRLQTEIGMLLGLALASTIGLVWWIVAL